MSKKLIEVALPLDAINVASSRENYIYRGNPSSLHKWWAQRPLAAARAVIFAQMVDDPSSWPEDFPTAKAQETERQRLFSIINELVRWESTSDEAVLQKARAEIWKSWRRTCARHAGESNAKASFDAEKLPAFHDPFAGGGTLPLEAQRLGLDATAADLNPVAVLICKAMIEIPPRFSDLRPVNPETRGAKTLLDRDWQGSQGLADDVRYYGRWIRDEAEKLIGQLYPTVEITKAAANEQPDLSSHVGEHLPVIAWIWARTVKSPDPAFAHVDVPLASTFVLSTKTGREIFVDPVVNGNGYEFSVRTGKPKGTRSGLKNGTKSGTSGSSFLCLMSGAPMPFEYLRAEAKAGRMGARLMAAVVEGANRRFYISPTSEMEVVANNVHPHDVPDTDLPLKALGFRVQEYGMTRWSDLFTPRQLVALTTLSDLVTKVRDIVFNDACTAGVADDDIALRADGTGARAYADAIATYLACAVDKYATYGNALVPWYTKEDRTKMLFSQQVVSMVWDYAEINPFSEVGGSFAKSVTIVSGALTGLPQHAPPARAFQRSATTAASERAVIVSTDPPYYDNIGYADLSDFFYVWLRRSVKAIFPDLFTTLTVPKAEELVAAPFRHGGKDQAEAFFLEGMTRAMRNLADQTHPSFPVTIYYAFKQSESGHGEGVANTGWETFLDAVIRAGLRVSGTWPMRTERTGRVRDHASNALASSVVLVCRPRGTDLPIATRREFVAELRAELPLALTHLQRGNIAPVDLAQAAIGPGMAVYTRFEKVIDAAGAPLSVRDALALINETLDEALAQQEGDFDADSRWAVAWFDQFGFGEGAYGIAETLSKAKNTSVAGLAEAGILASSRGKVRLLTPRELPATWDPTRDSRVTAWEVVHHLIKALELEGEGAAAAIVAELDAKAEVARELAYRLYTLCERKKRTAEALSYNGLVKSWPEIARLSREKRSPQAQQAGLFEEA